MESRRSEEEGRRTVGRPSPAHRPRSGNLRRGQIWGDLSWIRQSAGRPSTGRDQELRLRLRGLQRRRRRSPLSRSRSRRRPAVGPAVAAVETPPQSPLLELGLPLDLERCKTRGDCLTREAAKVGRSHATGEEHDLHLEAHHPGTDGCPLTHVMSSSLMCELRFYMSVTPRRTCVRVFTSPRWYSIVRHGHRQHSAAGMLVKR
jgi:hypothetical protein